MHDFNVNNITKFLQKHENKKEFLEMFLILLKIIVLSLDWILYWIATLQEISRL